MQVVVFVIVAQEAREVRRVRARIDVRIVMQVLRFRAQNGPDIPLCI